MIPAGVEDLYGNILQKMAWHQIGAKPFLESMLILDRLQPYK